MKKFFFVAALIAIAAVAYVRHRDQARKADGGDDVVLYGNIDIRQVQLGFRVGGRVREVLVDEGDTVVSGQILARLDAAPYRDALLLAQARKDSAAAALEKAVNGPRMGEIEKARATVDELSASLYLAQLTYERNENLLAANAVSREAFDQAAASRDAAQGRLRASVETLELLFDGTRKEDIETARAELRAMEASAASAQTSLADTDLFAPSGGVVISRVRETGAVVAAGETALVVSLDGPVWARAYVPEPLLGLVATGEKVDVTTDTRPDRPYQGVVGFVSPVAEFTPKSVETPELRTALVYRIRVIVNNPDSGLRQGMPVTIRIKPERE